MVIPFIIKLYSPDFRSNNRTDMDDPSTTITSQFGHSSQELMNLLLTGQAVSNVFDNSMTISDDLQCHGIQARPAIGYLSILESLRYCEVGSYFKSPLFPIWVVGSTSHFSVMFGDEHCLKESQSDQLLERCRRAFQTVEGGENGFIPVDKLGEVMNLLDLTTKVGGDNGVQTLKVYLEVSGAGIIIWDDFWKSASRLCSGSSIEALMTSEDMQIDNIVDDVPIQMDQYGQMDTGGLTTPPPAAGASDEEYAKKLAAEWGTAAKSDEDFARELQAQLNAESSDIVDLTSQIATTDDAASLDSIPPLSSRPLTPIDGGDIKMIEAAPTTDLKDWKPQSSKTQQLEFEKHGHFFPLFHYNGLYGGKLTPFRLTRLSPTEAVGASIALSGGAHGGAGGDLEDVVRCKWPSSLVNWLGKSAPSID